MSKPIIGSKGAGEWAEVLVTVLLAASILFLVFQIPEMVGNIASLISLASAEATARDLGGLITISGSAQDSITITYEGADESLFYDIEIKDRLVHITNIRKESGEPIGMIFGSTMKTGWGKTAVDGISEEFGLVNIFTIEKTRVVEEDGTHDDYDVSAY